LVGRGSSAAGSGGHLGLVPVAQGALDDSARGAARLVLELVLFGLAAAGYYGAGHPWIAVGFAALVLVSEIVTWTSPSA
jgi:hypothetical protein